MALLARMIVIALLIQQCKLNPQQKLLPAVNQKNWDISIVAQSEILEFPSSQSNIPCTATIPDYPLGQVWGTVGAVIQDKIVLCGGAYWGGDVPLFWSEECYILEQNPEDMSLYWEKFPSMSMKRAWASSAILEDGSWFPCVL